MAQSRPIWVEVYDQNTGHKIPNSFVKLWPIGRLLSTDSTGLVEFKNISPGRYFVTVEKPGYRPAHSEYFEHSSLKSTELQLNLGDKIINLEEVSIKGEALINANEAINPYTYLSARRFNSEDTDRIPMGINDPSRMALSIPGVQIGRNDLNNHLVVRGNSPYGVSYKVEGIDIPNPNHFANHGSGGGGVSVFSAQVIDKSEFLTGAMPAEYGNALAATFDIKLREGNRNHHLKKIKASMLGIDVSTEGPFNNQRTSYLLNYRYSTLGLLNWMTFYLAGNRTVNTFSDLSFNIAHRYSNIRHKTTLFGILGKSTEQSFAEPKVENRRNGVLEDWDERLRPSNMGVIGLSHQYLIDHRSSLKIVLAGTASQILRFSDTLSLTNQRFRYNTEKYVDNRLAVNIAFNKHLNESLKLKTGVQVQYIDFLFNRTTFPRSAWLDLAAQNLGKKIFANGSGKTYLAEAYALVEKNIQNKYYFNVGIHELYFGLNLTQSFEPRISIKYIPNSRNTFAAAFGVYSQLLPFSTYFVAQQLNEKPPFEYTYHYKNLAFPISKHLILSYRRLFQNDLKLGVEMYQQNISRSVIQALPESNFWILNSTDGYPGLGNLEAIGQGFNKGIDFSIEKLYFDKFFMILNASIFDATYKTFAGHIFNASFNNRFGSNLTLGREYTIHKSSKIQIGLRPMLNGGFLYTEPDLKKSNQIYVGKYSETNKLKAPNYRRIDSRIAYKKSSKTVLFNANIDIQNVTNYANVSRAFYNTVSRQIELQRKGTGFTPIVGMGIEW